MRSKKSHLSLRMVWPRVDDMYDTLTTTITIGGDLPVHRLGFGAMRLTGDPGRLDRSTAVAIPRRAVELRAPLIHTAHPYDLRDHQEPLAQAAHPCRGRGLIATNGGPGNTG